MVVSDAEIAALALQMQAHRDAMTAPPEPEAVRAVRAELARCPDSRACAGVMMERYGMRMKGTEFLPDDYDFTPDIEAYLATDRFRQKHAARIALDEEEAEARRRAYFMSLCRATKTGGTVLDPRKVAAWIGVQLAPIPFKGSIYVYDDGIYRENSGDIERIIKDVGDTVGVTESLVGSTREILAHIKATNPEHEYPFNRERDLLPVANGVLRVADDGTATLLEDSPDYRLTWRLPVTYDPAANPAIAETVVAQWVADDDVPILFQIPAQALVQAMRDQTWKKNYVLQGEPNAGKSTYIQMLLFFFGTANVANVSLQQIGTDRFVNGDLENRILNFYDDLAEVPLENVGRFKSLTGATHHRIDRKCVQAYEGRITCPHVFACNRPPTVPEETRHDPAFWERFEYVRFPFSFPTDPTWSERTLTPPFFSSLFNAVLARMGRIVSSRSLTVNRSADEVMERWSAEADPVYQFIKENLNETKGRTADFDRELLYGEYLRFCESEQVDPRRRLLGIPTFTRALQAYGIQSVVTSYRVGKRKESLRVYRGEFEWRYGQDSVKPRKEGFGEGIA